MIMTITPSVTSWHLPQGRSFTSPSFQGGNKGVFSFRRGQDATAVGGIVKILTRTDLLFFLMRSGKDQRWVPNQLSWIYQFDLGRQKKRQWSRNSRWCRPWYGYRRLKRNALLKHLRKHGCFLKREGSSHSLWCNPLNGKVEAIPRHTEIPNKLVKKICRGLQIKEIG